MSILFVYKHFIESDIKSAILVPNLYFLHVFNMFFTCFLHVFYMFAVNIVSAVYVDMCALLNEQNGDNTQFKYAI